MKFDDLDKKMRVFETEHDVCVLPGIYIVARLDGRSFTRLTKEEWQFEAPFDVQFRDIMVGTLAHLMDCGFKVNYGYTQSDEISLLLDFNTDLFQRKERKLNSILAGEASAVFSLLLGSRGVFDCRVSQLPSANLVMDYFRWRHEDAHRNALNAHCYWLARKQGKSPKAAAAEFVGVSVADKNEYLFRHGTNFNDLPNWQKRGTGAYWETTIKEGFNPLTGEAAQAERRSLRVDYDLPMKDEYSYFIQQFLAQ
ncbi:MAG: guanylyltransferase [Candidatus Thiothrix singaporensis]|uniref:tRNA(His) guanylyltransferase n=1 Tax=Candidatus Thiothrix singaporensis TaxID=2799669 RepID=A0A7L6AX20_9GAMM|nr:MAG: guanylyltransferase [Candidatus Thiothrix singaporensis]